MHRIVYGHDLVDQPAFHGGIALLQGSQSGADNLARGSISPRLNEGIDISCLFLGKADE